MKIVIADSETTGLVEPQACEIAFISMPENFEDFRELDIPDPVAFLTSHEVHSSVFEQRYRPTKAIDPRASQVTGIYMKDLLNCPSIREFEYPKSVEFMIGHNIAYDWRVFQKPDVKLICTKELAQLVYTKKDGLANHKLTTLVEFLYKEEGKRLTLKAHGALLDCKLVYLVLLKIVRKLPQVRDWNDLVSLCSQGTRSYEENDKVIADMTILPMGKYGGRRFSEVPTDYLKWLARQKDLSPALERAVKMELTSR
jgi:exodeoxyribonuclease X